MALMTPLLYKLSKAALCSILPLIWRLPAANEDQGFLSNMLGAFERIWRNQAAFPKIRECSNGDRFRGVHPHLRPPPLEHHLRRGTGGASWLPQERSREWRCCNIFRITWNDESFLFWGRETNGEEVNIFWAGYLLNLECHKEKNK